MARLKCTSISYSSLTELFNDLPVEQHCHTSFTDGRNSPNDMVLAAINEGLNLLVFTEHIQEQSDWVDSFIYEIEQLKLKFGNRIRIEYGFEAKAINYSGEVDIKKELISNIPLLMGSVHGYPHKKSGGFLELKEISKKQAIEMETELMIAMARNPDIDIIGHPFGVFQKHFGGFPEKRLSIILAEMKKFDTIFDINTKYHNDPLLLIRLCEQHQIRFSIGSDAHCADDIGKASKSIASILHDNLR